MNIDEMPAGRELDALVAEKVMEENFPKKMAFPTGKGKELLVLELGRAISLPHYSTNIAAAWQVVEKLGPPLVFNLLRRSEKYEARFVEIVDDGSQHFIASDKNAPLAICRAALEVVME